MHLAVAGVHLGDPSGRDALMKLGASGLSDVRPVAALVPSADLIELYEAVRTHTTASFGYRGEPRRGRARGTALPLRPLVPRRLGSRRAARENLPGDRWTARWRGANQAVPTCPSTSTSTPRCPTSRGRPRARHAVTMRLEVDAVEGPRVADEVGRDRVATRHDDGSVELAFAVMSFASIRSWVLGLFDHATIVDPPEFRQELVAWLEALAEAPDTVGAIATPNPEVEPSAAAGASAALGVESRPQRTRDPTGRWTNPSLRLACPEARRAVACGGCWPWWAGWPRWARPRSPSSRQRSAWTSRSSSAELEFGRVLWHTAVHAGHPDGDRGLRARGARFPPGRVRPTAATHAGRGFRRGGLGALLLAVPGSDDGALGGR